MRPVTSYTPAWNFDMTTAPIGRKMLVLHDGVAIIAVLSNTDTWPEAWCPLPKIPKEMK